MACLVRKRVRNLNWEKREKMNTDILNDYVKDSPAYRVGLTMDDVREDYVLADFRDDICKMNENENLLGVSPKAMEAIRQAVETINYYPEGTGKAVRRKLAERYGLSEYHYMITEGASVALNLVGEVFLKPGEEVIIPSQTYGAYGNVTRRYKGIPVIVPNREDKSIDLDGILQAVTDKTRLIFLCNPNNPTGMTCDDDALLSFLKKVPKDVMVVVDEAYFQFIRKPGYKTAIHAITEEDCNVIVVRTFSKVYGMAGARIGYVVSSLEVIRYMSRMVNYFCTNKLALVGALAALDDTEFEELTLKTVAEEKDYLTEELQKMGFFVCPSDSNFLFVDFQMDAHKLCEEMQKQGIILRGDYDFVRISIGTRKQDERVIKALKEYFGK